MTRVYTPHGGLGAEPRRPPTDRRTGVSVVEHAACCAAGLGAAVLCLVLFYPALVAATRPLHVLSSTAIVFALAWVWLLVWVGVELAWEWRAGRFAASK